MSPSERAVSLNHARTLSDVELERAIDWCWSAVFDGADADYCDARREVYEQARDERVMHLPHTAVELDSIRWDGDNASVELTDGCEFYVDAREERGGELHFELFTLLIAAGLEVCAHETALCWLRAHEAEIRESYDAHCRDERWADDA